eukprot:641059-Rhodomonas_salina.4
MVLSSQRQHAEIEHTKKCAWRSRFLLDDFAVSGLDVTGVTVEVFDEVVDAQAAVEHSLRVPHQPVPRRRHPRQHSRHPFRKRSRYPSQKHSRHPPQKHPRHPSPPSI